MKLKPTVLLATFVVTLGLLLGASAASWAQPEPATLISPSGTITDNTPTYTWNAVANSAQYRLFVWDSTETPIIVQWYTAEEAGCGDGESECSVTPESMLANDSHEWWIQTKNDNGNGDWSDGMSFTVEGSTSPAPVPRTGEIESVIAGDDGDLQKGVPWPDPRFTDNTDGTVTDNLTGLIWLQDSGCIKDDAFNSPYLIWPDAVDAPRELEDGMCGLGDSSVPGDWRLPNVRELLSIIDYGSFQPALPTNHPFTNIEATASYWTSTIYIDDGNPATGRFAWAIDMAAGNVVSAAAATTVKRVWPVRDGN